MKIIAVVVTYNRLLLLKECINALQVQTIIPDEVIVVNNDSSDGTTEWLATQSLQTINQENRGGSWGFYTGIKAAYAKGADWVWIMDDDTIPTATALEKLLLPTSAGIKNIGYLGSKVLWNDNTPHLMNLPSISTFDVRHQPFNRWDQQGILVVNSLSFVSILVSRKAIEAVGLPIKEFFIWSDDMEYTQRISKHGFIGAYVTESIVLHKTPTNHFSDLYVDDVKNLWKYRYGIRNELVYFRLTKGDGKFWSALLKRIFIYPIRIIKKRKNHKWTFIKMVWKASFSAIGFKPTIEKVV